MALALLIVIFLSLLAGGGYANGTGLFAAAAGMAALVVIGFLPRGRRVLAPARGIAGPAFLFGVVIVVAAVQIATPGALDRELAIIHLLRLVGGAAVFLAAVVVGRSARALRVLGRGFSFAGLGFVILSLVLYALHPHTPQDLDGGRLTATFTTSPNTAAAVIGVIGLVALGGLLQRLRRLPGGLRLGARIERAIASAWLEIATLGLAIVTLGLTGSRSGVALIILCALCLIVWAGFSDTGKPSRSTGARALGLLALVAAIGVGASVTFARLPSIGGDAASRTQIYQAHWPLLFDHPFIGHGFGSFVILNRELVTPANFAALTWVGDMHNVFMQWIEEMGFIGAGAMFACIGWILVVIVRAAGRVETSRTWLKTIGAASLFLILQGLVEIALQYEAVVMLWALLLGSGFGLATSEARQPSQPENAP